MNLSARTLCHPALERLITDALTAGGIDAARLVIDISESVTADPAHVVVDALHALRGRGVRIALDDFGRGSSALSRLEQLPIDQIKVDSMFLAGVEDDHAPAPVAEAIVAMGHGLGLQVVAEGVETVGAAGVRGAAGLRPRAGLARRPPGQRARLRGREVAHGLTRVDAERHDGERGVVTPLST